MTGPRLTTPASKLIRSISTTATASVPKSNTLLTSSKNAAPLSRKYADLLKERNIDPDHPRHLYTRSSNRPHPPPRTMRLMQSFTSGAAQAPSQADASTMDRIIFPGSAALEGSSNDPFAHLRVPLLPDNSATHHVSEATDGPVAPAQISIVAANPELVSPAALTEVEGMGIDGVELKFVHVDPSPEPEHAQGMLTNLWKGLDDVILGAGRNSSKGNVAL